MNAKNLGLVMASPPSVRNPTMLMRPCLFGGEVEVILIQITKVHDLCVS